MISETARTSLAGCANRRSQGGAPKVLVDTDVVVDLIRKYPPALAWLTGLADEEVWLPGFAAMELLQGCRNKAEQRILERELRAFIVVWPSPEACTAALDVFARRRLGSGLGMLDALIGVLAADLELPLHTFNRKHYTAIPRLKTRQPYRKG